MTKTADRHMRPTDAFTWYMERDPLLRSTVVVVGLLDRAPGCLLPGRAAQAAAPLPGTAGQIDPSTTAAARR